MMKIISVILLIILSLNCYFSQYESCPCDDQSLCEPLSVGPRLEFLGFSVQNNTWENYDFNVLTTIGVFYPASDLPGDLLCAAHQKNVRLVWGVDYPISQLSNYTYQEEWIQNALETVQNTFMDGINIDVEDAIDQTEPYVAALLTGLVAKAYSVFKAVNPNYQVTFDVAWSPNCIDGRCYDFLGLAMATDFLVVMDYDMESQMITDHCTARANAPPFMMQAGMQAFLNLGIPATKLLMGMPWYGYNYECVGEGMSINDSVCTIAWTVPPYRGCNCSDAVGFEWAYQDLIAFYNDPSNTVSPIQWNSYYSAPWFNYLNESDGTIHQIWFDNPQSLTVRIDMAKNYGLQGLSVWNIDEISNDVTSYSQDMWAAIQAFF